MNYFYVQKDKLLLKKDKIEVSENLFIPEGFKVILKPSQKILLKNNAFIISESIFIANGGEKKGKETIMIGGTKDNYGGGILIKDTKNLNFFQNVTFKNLNGNIDFIPEGYLTFGAINFFNSKVNFDNFFGKSCISFRSKPCKKTDLT